jgi:hypothetical protein
MSTGMARADNAEPRADKYTDLLFGFQCVAAPEWDATTVSNPSRENSSPRSVVRLDHTVGIEDEQVARVQLNRSGLETYLRQ